MGTHDLSDLIAAGMLEHADRHDLVILAPHVPEIGVYHVQRSGEPAPVDLRTHHVHLLGDRRVDDGIKRLEEIQHAQRQTSFRIMLAVVRHINVGICEVEEFHS